jgi:nitrogen fixation/metabolism regulation signal transduction histidine kinase
MTGYYFNNLLKNNESKSYREQIISINNSIQSYVNSAIDEESKILVLSKSLNKITDIHGQEISLYSRAGKLISFTEIHEDMLRLPAGYSEIKLQTRDIEFKGVPKTIVPLSIASQPPYAYFTITFPKSPRSYSSILDFISTILNVYVFLFLIAGAIALAIANSITRPLSIIAGKLKEFKLGASNKPLIYEDNDEIGQLINEYNNLIVQVQDSADIIAKTERDMAWREMAKQVAHEIKNPLTPMKLSIQYLDKMVKTNPDRAKDLTEKVASTLVTQIDALTNIANEFSNYATMPKANNEKIILNEIVEAVHDLFRKRDDMDITMSEPIADLLVFVDRNQLIRILNNLVKNAIQAIPDDRRGKIDIALNKKNHSAIITVKDNGTGIPDYMKQKVFTPNFTTKNSGTGLGLAISANMIDSMNGRIYFDTRIYEGTTFFVEIPLMRTEQKPKESGTRVSLDD